MTESPSPAARDDAAHAAARAVAIVSVAHRRLDGERARTLIADVTRAFERGARVVAIDLGLVTFIDSLGVASHCAAARRAPIDGEVDLAALGDYAQTVARITRMDEVFAIYRTVDAVLAHHGH
jgi:anti-sigma B factor antagonist